MRLLFCCLCFVAAISSSEAKIAFSSDKDQCLDSRRSNVLEKELQTADSLDQQEVARSITELGRLRCGSSIATLIRLLDKQRPESDAEKKGFRLHAHSVLEMYPAVTALVNIGNPAVQPLTFKLLDSSANDKIIENASFAIGAIYRGRPLDGVRLLRSIELKSVRTDHARIIHSQAEKEASLCGASELQQCESALAQN